MLNARATVPERDGTRETGLADVVSKRHLLPGLHWHAPVASGYHEETRETGGPPPLVVATAVHAGDDGRHHLGVAVRDGYEVVSGAAPCSTGPGRVLRALVDTELGALPPKAWGAVRREASGLLARTAGT